MLSRLILILLIGLIGIILAYMIMAYINGLTVAQDRAIITSWRPLMINGYYQCPNGYVLGPGNKSGYYPCGPCIITITSNLVNLTCP